MGEESEDGAFFQAAHAEDRFPIPVKSAGLLPVSFFEGAKVEARARERVHQSGRDPGTGGRFFGIDDPHAEAALDRGEGKHRSGQTLPGDEVVRGGIAHGRPM
jgi:hypothetical protein